MAAGVAMACAVALATGLAAGEGGDPQARLGELDATAKPPVSVDWVRTPNARALMRGGRTSAVRASVVSVAAAPPITAADARAPEGTPSLKRQLITLRVSDHLAGPPVDAQFDLVRVLPPSGVVAEEDIPWKPGEEYVLFVSPSEMPGDWQPRSWQLVSLDGRLPVGADKRLRGLLEGGPAEELNNSSDLKKTLKEASE